MTTPNNDQPLLVSPLPRESIPRTDPDPTIGQHVRRRDDGRVGFVRYIVKDGAKRTRPQHMFMFVGDVDVFMAGTYGTSIITHSSRFWQSWELVKCDRCNDAQCVHYVKLVDLGMSFELAVRFAAAMHSDETLLVSPDEHIEIRQLLATDHESNPLGDAALLSDREPIQSMPTVTIIVDRSKDSES